MTRVSKRGNSLPPLDSTRSVQSVLISPSISKMQGKVNIKEEGDRDFQSVPSSKDQGSISPRRPIKFQDYSTLAEKERDDEDATPGAVSLPSVKTSVTPSAV